MRLTTMSGWYALTTTAIILSCPRAGQADNLLYQGDDNIISTPQAWSPAQIPNADSWLEFGNYGTSTTPTVLLPASGSAGHVAAVDRIYIDGHEPIAFGPEVAGPPTGPPHLSVNQVRVGDDEFGWWDYGQMHLNPGVYMLTQTLELDRFGHLRLGQMYPSYEEQQTYLTIQDIVGSLGYGDEDEWTQGPTLGLYNGANMTHFGVSPVELQNIFLSRGWMNGSNDAPSDLPPPWAWFNADTSCRTLKVGDGSIMTVNGTFSLAQNGFTDVAWPYAWIGEGAMLLVNALDFADAVHGPLDDGQYLFRRTVDAAEWPVHTGIIEVRGGAVQNVKDNIFNLVVPESTVVDDLVPEFRLVHGASLETPELVVVDGNEFQGAKFVLSGANVYGQHSNVHSRVTTDAMQVGGFGDAEFLVQGAASVMVWGDLHIGDELSHDNPFPNSVFRMESDGRPDPLEVEPTLFVGGTLSVAPGYESRGDFVMRHGTTLVSGDVEAVNGDVDVGGVGGTSPYLEISGDLTVDRFAKLLIGDSGLVRSSGGVSMVDYDAVVVVEDYGELICLGPSTFWSGGVFLRGGRIECQDQLLVQGSQLAISDPDRPAVFAMVNSNANVLPALELGDGEGGDGVLQVQSGSTAVINNHVVMDGDGTILEVAGDSSLEIVLDLNCVAGQVTLTGEESSLTVGGETSVGPFCYIDVDDGAEAHFEHGLVLGSANSLLLHDGGAVAGGSIDIDAGLLMIPNIFAVDPSASLGFDWASGTIDASVLVGNVGHGDLVMSNDSDITVNGFVKIGDGVHQGTLSVLGSNLTMQSGQLSVSSTGQFHVDPSSEVSITDGITGASGQGAGSLHVEGTLYVGGNGIQMPPQEDELGGTVVLGTLGHLVAADDVTVSLIDLPLSAHCQGGRFLGTETMQMRVLEVPSLYSTPVQSMISGGFEETNLIVTINDVMTPGEIGQVWPLAVAFGGLGDGFASVTKWDLTSPHVDCDIRVDQWNQAFELWISPTEPGDLTLDGLVNGSDVIRLLNGWGGDSVNGCNGLGIFDLQRFCAEDINQDHVVDVRDLLILLSNWQN